jgi:hypothetical protein
MPDRGLLERFRPAAAPGSAGRVGVPADSTDDVALLAVLAGLGPAQEEAERLRDRARTDARALRDAAEVQAAALLARARLDAAEQRADAAARAREAGELAGRRLVDEAVEEAARLRAEGLRRLPDLVAEVVALVRSDGASSAPDGRAAGGGGR